MFQKNTFSIPSDSSGIYLVKVIQTRRCSTTKHAKINKFLRVVVRNTKTKLNKIKKKKNKDIVVIKKNFNKLKYVIFYNIKKND